MLRWLAWKTEKAQIHSRMELPVVRQHITRIISSYTSSKFFLQHQQGISSRQLKGSRGETALQIAERQMDHAIAGYYSQAHPEIAAFIGEDWGADHTGNLRRTSLRLGHEITDPGSICIEVIAPELILLWIMEDLSIDRDAAFHILHCTEASDYGRLVLEGECVENQVSHDTNAHSQAEGLANAPISRLRRKRQPRKYK